MRDMAGRLTGVARAVALAALATAAASPAAAQLGGLKKKLKAATGAPEAPANAAGAGGGGGGGGGTIVLTDDVLERFVKGVRAGEAARDAAKTSNTPYGRHLQAVAAFEAAQPKCQAAMAAWPQRAAADEKLMARYSAYADKMAAAQEKQDYKLMQVYSDSAMALQDPSCTVKQPERPSNWNDLQREVDGQAEQRELEASGFDRNELGQVRDRAYAILADTPPPDVSKSERDAVEKREQELKKLMGMEQPPPAPAAKPAPAAAPAPAPAGPGLSPGQQAMSNCMAKNAEKHEDEIRRLGERAAAAAEANDIETAMVFSDSIRQIQMTGCEGN